MPYLYLVLSVFCTSTSSIFGSFYNAKNKCKADPSGIYNLLQLLTVCLGWWILFAVDFSFNASVLFYSLGFGVSFGVCTFSVISALKTGPITISTLFVQLSMIAVTVWGFFFWNTQLTPLVIVGLVLVVASIVLCLLKEKSTETERKFSWKWLLFAALSFLSNASCGIIQRTQQSKFEGEYGNMMMAFAMLFSVAVGVILYLKSDRRDTRSIVKTSWYYPFLSGAFNVVFNLLVMLMATTTLSPSLIYPVISVGALAVTTLFSTLVFKEKLNKKQWVGLSLGVIAVALLSI